METHVGGQRSDVDAPGAIVKLRLEPQSLTQEDSLIWCLVVTRFPCPGAVPYGALWGRSIAFDLRDFELMWKLEIVKQRMWPLKPKGYRRCIVQAIIQGGEQVTGDVTFP